MTEGIICPADGCNYGEKSEKSIGSVKSHINAMSDPDHQNKSVLRSAVEEQAVGAVEESDDEEPEAAEEQAESDEKPDEERPEEQAKGGEEAGEEDDEMATDEEYQQQQQAEGGKATDKSTDDSDDGDADVPATSAGLVSLLPGRSPVMWLGVALLALLLVSLYMDGGSTETETPTSEQAQEPPATPTEAAQRGGGLHE